MTKLALIALASGLSSRFGQENKLLAHFRGKPLCSHTANYWHRKPATRKFVVVPKYEPKIAAIFERKNWIILTNPNPDAGQSESLKIGIQAAQSEGATTAMICLADMPLVATSHLDAILNAASEHQAVMSSSRGVLMPPAAFRKELFGELTKLSGDQGAKAVFLNCNNRVSVELPQGTEIDVDTPEDLALINAERQQYA